MMRFRTKRRADTARFVAVATVLLISLLGAAVLATQQIRSVEPRAEPNDSAVPYVGLTYVTLSHEIAARYSVGVESGVLVTAVAKGGPAEAAGLQRGDVLLALDAASLAGGAPLTGFLAEKRHGDTLTLQVQRQGKSFSTELTLGTR